MSGAPTYAHSITGRAPSRVLVHGEPLARFDMIRHADGSSWRYESLSLDNRAVIASSAATGLQRFALGTFGIVIVDVCEAT